MYSQCPRCRTIFMVAPADLAAARGDTVCGHCGSLFNALRNLSEFPPEPGVADLAEHEQDLPAPPLRLPVAEPTRDAVSSFNPDADAAGDGEPPKPPVFIPTPGRRGTDLRWWSVAALLLCSLLVELAWAKRSDWIGEPNLRPLLQSVCATVGCRMPLRQDLSLLALTSREIRPHPSMPGALLISATIRNEANFAQAFPAVKVRLSDLNEQPVAARRFLPGDYLVDPDDAQRGLAPQASAVIVFEVADPGRAAVAFEFNFE